MRTVSLRGMAGKSQRTTDQCRAPTVLSQLPLSAWYRKELEQQLRELGCTFTPKDKTVLLVRKLERAGFDPTSLVIEGSNRPSSSRPRSSPSRKRRRVTLTLPDDNVLAQEEFQSEAPVAPACPLRRKKNARTRPSVHFEQIQESVQEEGTSGPSRQENDFVESADELDTDEEDFPSNSRRQKLTLQEEVAEAVRNCLPDMVKAMVANVGLPPSQSDANAPFRLDSHHSSSSNAGTRAMAIPFSFCYGVPEEVIRKALAGKYVPLYKFLPGFSEREEGQAYVPIPREDGSLTFSVQLSEKDQKLGRRQLGIAEFCRAFLCYKAVICEEFPDRQKELDAYLAHILDLSSRYSGNAYWLYHTQFFRKASTQWEYGVRVNWASIDPEVLHRAISAREGNFCDHCQNHFHASLACPFTLSVDNRSTSFSNSVPPPSFGSPHNRTNKPEHRAYHKGKQICDNFNFRSCKHQKDCKFLHICRCCQKDDHPMRKCPKNGEF